MAKTMLKDVLTKGDFADKLAKIAEAHSLEEQWEKLIEEMAELIVAIKHRNRKGVLPQVNRLQLNEEVADVLILLEQITEHLIDIDDYFDIANVIKKKIDREVERISNE